MQDVTHILYSRQWFHCWGYKDGRFFRYRSFVKAFSSNNVMYNTTTSERRSNRQMVNQVGYGISRTVCIFLHVARGKWFMFLNDKEGTKNYISMNRSQTRSIDLNRPILMQMVPTRRVLYQLQLILSLTLINRRRGYVEQTFIIPTERAV